MITNRFFKWVSEEYDKIIYGLDDSPISAMALFSSVLYVVLILAFLYYLISLYQIWQFWLILFVSSEALFWADKRKTYDGFWDRFWMTLSNKLGCMIDTILLAGLGAIVWNKIIPYWSEVLKGLISFFKGFGVVIGVIGLIFLITYLNSLKHKVKRKKK